MTTSEAASEAVKLLPKHSIICSEAYQSTHHGDYRAEELRYCISVHPALVGNSPCQQFQGKAFKSCLEEITRTLAILTPWHTLSQT